MDTANWQAVSDPNFQILHIRCTRRLLMGTSSDSGCHSGRYEGESCLRQPVRWLPSAALRFRAVARAHARAAGVSAAAAQTHRNLGRNILRLTSLQFLCAFVNESSDCRGGDKEDLPPTSTRLLSLEKTGQQAASKAGKAVAVAALSPTAAPHAPFALVHHVHTLTFNSARYASAEARHTSVVWAVDNS
eukprot:6207888-Pleurochrysis_carterae.AAC.2